MSEREGLYCEKHICFWPEGVCKDCNAETWAYWQVKVGDVIYADECYQTGLIQASEARRLIVGADPEE